MHHWVPEIFGVNIQPFMAPITLLDESTLHTVNDAMPMFLPHEMLAQLWAVGPDQIRCSMAPIWNDIEAYWIRAEETDWGRRHSVNSDPELRAHRAWTVPAAIHVDGMNYRRNTEGDVWSWSSLLAKSSTWDSKLLICVIPHERIVPQVTTDEVVKVLSWSFEAMKRGLYPATGPFGERLDDRRRALAGQPLAGNFRCAFAAFKSDLKARVEIHGFRQNYMAARMCELRHAHKTIPELIFTDFGPEARLACFEFPPTHNYYQTACCL